MSKKIVLDSDIADRICAESIRHHIKYVKKSIKRLEKMKALEDFQEQDLRYDTFILESLQEVYKYYRGGKE